MTNLLILNTQDIMGPVWKLHTSLHMQNICANCFQQKYFRIYKQVNIELKKIQKSCFQHINSGQRWENWVWTLCRAVLLHMKWTVGDCTSQTTNTFLQLSLTNIFLNGNICLFITIALVFLSYSVTVRFESRLLDANISVVLNGFH